MPGLKPIFLKIKFSYVKEYPTNTTPGFQVEMTWKRPFPRPFNVESTWCVCSVKTVTKFYYKVRCDRYYIILVYRYQVRPLLRQDNGNSSYSTDFELNSFFFSTFIKELLLFSFIAIFYGRKAIYGITKLLCF